ncbi:MAG: cobalamin-dependent protein, partial [Clostridia bacterium]|nr:cobalamin-dependent protein [Clostridia bacterium]
AEGRLAIAEKILHTAEQYGITKEDLIFDPLAMSVSADSGAALQTLRAVRLIREKLGCHTSLGVSNVSFGLPDRDAINSVFFAQAMENGLSAAILNPDSEAMRRAWYTHRVLHGLDENCADYINFAQMCPMQNAPVTATVKESAAEASGSELQRAIVKGLGERAAQITAAMLESTEPLAIVQGEIIPALDTVGTGFEKKTVYLPQLLMSAEAAKAAFGEIKRRMERLPRDSAEHGIRIVLATVHGDIHDIGKNIVRLLLENYGFEVTDLGRDVPAETVLDEVLRIYAPVAGLSALMTTTVPAMEETVRLIHERAPWCKVMVGGAVLTREYADSIGADHYCKDAMEAVRYAETFKA